MSLSAVFGDAENGQPWRRCTKDGQPIHGIIVMHNHCGDVMIVRHGESVAWLDMSRDVALWLALELIEHAQADKASLAMHMLGKIERKQIA